MSDIGSTVELVKVVTKRELNQQTASVLAAVREGDPVIVTERGLPRWRIEEAGLSDLDRGAGVGLHVTPARSDPIAWPTGDGNVYSAGEIEELQSWARGDN